MGFLAKVRDGILDLPKSIANVVASPFTDTPPYAAEEFRDPELGANATGRGYKIVGTVGKAAAGAILGGTTAGPKTNEVLGKFGTSWEEVSSKIPGMGSSAPAGAGSPYSPPPPSPTPPQQPVILPYVLGGGIAIVVIVIILIAAK